jgi:diacylglycerol kinase (ATP)
MQNRPMTETLFKPHPRCPVRAMIRRARTSLAGLAAGARRDSSVRDLWLFCAVALGALCVAAPAPVWWAIVIMAGSAALAVEYLNTALETALDRLHPGHDRAIGLAKDLASGAAFTTNIVSVLVLGLALAFG